MSDHMAPHTHTRTALSNSPAEQADFQPTTQLRSLESAPLMQLQAAANASPQVQQLRHMQAGINQSPQVQQLKAQQGAALPVQRKENRTGMPDQLKGGIEQLSGMSMDDVRVHYNSAEPARLQAHAFAQGSNIHIAPGQEQHLAHEAWHVVQQKQGRVRATQQLKGEVGINDDEGLEHEADEMGAKAMQMTGSGAAEAADKPLQEIAAHDGVAQCFSELGKKDYDLEGGSETEDYFTSQSKGLSHELSDLTGKYSFGLDVSRSNKKKDLLLSDDKSMAIHDSKKEVKEFYALPQVVEDSNKALKERGGKVNLQTSDSLGLSPEDGAGTLLKVTPKLAEEDQEIQEGQFLELISNICIEVASNIMGHAGDTWVHEAVFQRPGKKHQNTAKLRSNPRLGDSKIGTLAEGMVDSDPQTLKQSLRDDMYKKPSPKVPGLKYGKALGNGELDGISEKMGVNQYAQPEVGEAYATFSLPSHPGGKKINYATGGRPKEIIQNTWGYHYAGVVARSLDSADSITLENYNREETIMNKVTEILSEFALRHSSKLMHEWEDIMPQEGQDPRTFPDKLKRAFEIVKGQSKEEARKEYYTMQGTYKPDQSWFFKMQGSHEGQTFHDQQARTDDYYNPLTLRVRPTDPALEEKRTQAKVKILRFPDIPHGLENHEEFKAYMALRNQLNEEAGNQETAGKAERFGDKVLPRMAKLCLVSIARTQVALVKEGKGKLPKNILEGITTDLSVKRLAEAVRAVGFTTHLAITDVVNNLSIFGDPQLELRQAPSKVFALWDMIPSIVDYVK